MERVKRFSIIILILSLSFFYFPSISNGSLKFLKNRLKLLKKTKNKLLLIYASLLTREKYFPLKFKNFEDIKLLEKVVLSSIKLVDREEKEVRKRIWLAVEMEKKKMEEKRRRQEKTKIEKLKKEIKIKVKKSEHLKIAKQVPIKKFSVSKKISSKKINKKNKNKNTFTVLDPLSGRPTIPRNFNGIINHPVSIFAPFTGKIDSLGMRGTTLFIVLKGQRCRAVITGIDDLTINLGAKVKAGEIIGKVKQVPKNFSFKVECSK